MNFFRILIFLMVLYTTVVADMIPSSPLFIDLKKAEKELSLIPEDFTFKLMPLSGWGETRFPSSEQKEDEGNIIVEGAFEQGLLLIKYSDSVFLQTFGKLDYKKDSKKFYWNNQLKLGTGIKLNYLASKNFAINVGVKYEWDYRIESDHTLKGFMVFSDWIANWSLDSSSLYPGFTWGGVRYPGSQDIEDQDNLVLEGAMEQGYDWYSDGTVTINTFARFAYTLDTEGYEWNNHVNYGIGTKLKFPIKDSAGIAIGFRLIQDKRLESGRTEEQIIWFSNWYF